MKIKYIIIYSALAVAFAAVCAWVFLSGGRSARAIRAKFRLGGMLLTVGSILSFTSCAGGGPFVTCYAVALSNQVELNMPNPGSMNVKPGESIGVVVYGPSYSSYKYRISAAEGNISIQSGMLPLDSESTGTIQLGQIDYKGSAVLTISGIQEAKEYEVFSLLIEIQ